MAMVRSLNRREFVTSGLAASLVVPAAPTMIVRAGSENEDTILINPFAVPGGKEAEAIAMWEQARNYLTSQPGYISTALHQSISPNATYRLVNVANWESAEAFKAASQSMRENAGLERVEGERDAVLPSVPGSHLPVGRYGISD